MLLLGCGKSDKEIAKFEELMGKPCNIKVVVHGKAPHVSFKLFSKAKEKAVTIFKEVNVLDEKKDEFSFSSYSGGKLSCELKTKDSYGPEVTISLFLNGKLWQEKTGRYNPKINCTIPSQW